jgi:hypothetical protein
LPSEEAESFDLQCLETARLWVRLNEPDEEWKRKNPAAVYKSMHACTF